MFLCTVHCCVGWVLSSLLRLATGWTVQGSNPVGGEIFRIHPDRPAGAPSLLYNGYRVFSGGKEWPGRDADPSPPSSAVVMKGQSYTCTPPIGRTACTQPQCPYKSALYSMENKPHNTTVHDTTTLSRHIIPSHHGLHLYEYKL